MPTLESPDVVDLNFEPSTTTKKLWLGVRKQEKTVEGITLPGLFQIADFNLDVIAFLVIIGLETWGLVNLHRVGVAAFYIICMAGIDFVFAICRHIPQGAICEHRNQLVVASDAKERENLRGAISRLRFWSGVLSAPIVGVAVWKVYSFWGLQQQGVTGLTIILSLSYALVALLHIARTGFFLYGVITDLFFRYDLRLHLKSEGPNPRVTVQAYRPHRFQSDEPLTPVKVFRHKLSKEDESSSYVLSTYGLLTDQHLQGIIGEQITPEAKRILAREGLKHQLEILKDSPRAPTEPGVKPLPSEEEIDQPRRSVVDLRDPKRKLSLTAVGAILLCLTACVPAVQESNDQTFPLTIVTTGQVLANQNVELPKDFIELCLPFAGQGCAPTTLFYPQVTIVRNDHEGDQTNFLQPIPAEVRDCAKKRINFAQKFYAKEPSIEQVRQCVRETVANKSQLAKVLLAEPTGAHQTGTVQAAYSNRDAKVFVYDPTGASRRASGAATVAGDYEQLIGAVSSYLCSLTVSVKTAGSVARHCVVYYKPSMEGDGAEHHEEPQSVEDVEMQVGDPQADAELADLIARSRPCVDALKRSQPCPEAEHLSQEWIIAENKYGRDYRFPYEHAKLLVLGWKKHDPAFQRLYDAAERAITAQKADVMLTELAQDDVPDGAFHKLVVGHGEWGTIKEALQSRDRTKLWPGPAAHEHQKQ